MSRFDIKLGPPRHVVYLPPGKGVGPGGFDPLTISKKPFGYVKTVQVAIPDPVRQLLDPGQPVHASIQA